MALTAAAFKEEKAIGVATSDALKFVKGRQEFWQRAADGATRRRRGSGGRRGALQLVDLTGPKWEDLLHDDNPLAKTPSADEEDQVVKLPKCYNFDDLFEDVDEKNPTY